MAGAPTGDCAPPRGDEWGVRVPTITGVEFFQFSAKHHNASRNWLLLKLLTDEPGLHGLGDASPMENDAEVRALVQGWMGRYLSGKNPLDSEVIWTSCTRTSRRAQGGWPRPRSRASTSRSGT